MRRPFVAPRPSSFASARVPRPSAPPCTAARSSGRVRSTGRRPHRLGTCSDGGHERLTRDEPHRRERRWIADAATGELGLDHATARSRRAVPIAPGLLVHQRIASGSRPTTAPARRPTGRGRRSPVVGSGSVMGTATEGRSGSGWAWGQASGSAWEPVWGSASAVGWASGSARPSDVGVGVGVAVGRGVGVGVAVGLGVGLADVVARAVGLTRERGLLAGEGDVDGRTDGDGVGDAAGEHAAEERHPARRAGPAEDRDEHDDDQPDPPLASGIVDLELVRPSLRRERTVVLAVPTAATVAAPAAESSSSPGPTVSTLSASTRSSSSSSVIRPSSTSILGSPSTSSRPSSSGVRPASSDPSGAAGSNGSGQISVRGRVLRFRAAVGHCCPSVITGRLSRQPAT